MTDVVKIDSMDTVHAAFADAKARANVVFKTSKCLVDTISKEDWNSWDASDEVANVGKGSITDDDEFEVDQYESSAA